MKTDFTTQDIHRLIITEYAFFLLMIARMDEPPADLVFQAKDLYAPGKDFSEEVRDALMSNVCAMLHSTSDSDANFLRDLEIDLKEKGVVEDGNFIHQWITANLTTVDIK